MLLKGYTHSIVVVLKILPIISLEWKLKKGLENVKLCNSVVVEEKLVNILMLKFDIIPFISSSDVHYNPINIVS